MKWKMSTKWNAQMLNSFSSTHCNLKAAIKRYSRKMLQEKNKTINFFTTAFQYFFLNFKSTC